MKRLLTAALLAYIAGCSVEPVRSAHEPLTELTPATVRIADGEAFELRPGESAMSPDGSLFIAFRGVAHDSRCPIDTTCVWEGNAATSVGTAGPGERWRWTTLNTALEPRSLTTPGYVVHLVAVDPAVRSNTSIPPDAYRAVLRLVRR